MKNVLRKVENGEAEIAVAAGRQSLHLRPYSAVRIANLAGAQVRITNDGQMVRIESKVPESGESLRWDYPLEAGSYNGEDGGYDLASLIASSRVALNGSL